MPRGDKAAKYKAYAQKAIEIYQSGEGLNRDKILNEENRLLYLFYRVAYREEADNSDAFGDEAGNRHWIFVLQKCYKGIAEYPVRIPDAETLAKVKGFGNASVKIANVLWELAPAQPLTAQEQAHRQLMDANNKEFERAKQRAAYQKRKDKKSGGAGNGGGSIVGVVGGHNPLMPNFGADLAGFGGLAGGNAPRAVTMAELRRALGEPVDHEFENATDDSDGGGGGKKKKPSQRAKKPYVPKTGTANYAILITLYISQKEGHEYETKHNCMQKAEESGLSDKSLYNANRNQGMVNPGDRFYDGWSGVNQYLVNGEPPLVICYSNPKKARLTGAGTILAAKLYKDALRRGKLEPRPDIDPDADIPPEEEVPIEEAGNAGGVAAAGAAKGGAGRGRGRKKKDAAEDLGEDDNDGDVLTPKKRKKSGKGAGRGTEANQHPAQVGPMPGLQMAGDALFLPGVGGSQMNAARGRSSAKAKPPSRRMPSPDLNSDDFYSSDDDNKAVMDELKEHAAPNDAYGAWGGALPDKKLGMQFDSDEERDPYAYNLHRKLAKGATAAGGPQRPVGIAGNASNSQKHAVPGKHNIKSASEILLIDDDDDEGAQAMNINRNHEQESDGDEPAAKRRREKENLSPNTNAFTGAGHKLGAAAAGVAIHGKSPAAQLAAEAALRRAGVTAAAGTAAAAVAGTSNMQVSARRDTLLGQVLGTRNSGPGVASGAARGGGASPDEGPEVIELSDSNDEGGRPAGAGAGRNANGRSGNAGRAVGGNPLTATFNVTLDDDDDDDDRDLPTSPFADRRVQQAANAFRQGLPAQVDDLGTDHRKLLGRSSGHNPLAHVLGPGSGPSSANGMNSTGAGNRAAPGSGLSALLNPGSGQGAAGMAGGRPGNGGGLAKRGSGPPALPVVQALQAGLPPRGSGSLAFPAAAPGSGGLPRAAPGGVAALLGQGSGGLAGRASGDLNKAASGQLDIPDDVRPYGWPAARLQSEATPLRLPPIDKGRTFASQYEVVLVIDNREQLQRGEGMSFRDKAMQELQKMGVAVELGHFECGDYTWIARKRGTFDHTNNTYILDCLMERKSCPDLNSSITSDSRWQRQKWKLSQSGLQHVCLLLEGRPEQYKELTESARKSIHTVCYQLQVDGMRVHRSEGVSDTIKFLARFTKSLQRRVEAQISSVAPGQDIPGCGEAQLYEDWASTQRAMHAKSARRVKDVWACMLSSVSGCAGCTADTIVKMYPTPQRMYKAYQQCIAQARSLGRDPLAAAREMLYNVTLPGGQRVASKSTWIFDQLFKDGML